MWFSLPTVSWKPPNPIVSVEVAKVDTDAILANAMSFDTQGNRQAEVRQLITDGLGLADVGSSLLPPEMEISWRGSRRNAEILFGNVREQSFDTLKGREGTWREPPLGRAHALALDWRGPGTPPDEETPAHDPHSGRRPNHATFPAPHARDGTAG